MLVDMGTITRKNVHEFWARYCAMNMGDKPYLSCEDIYNHIGLTTNVTTITRAAFMKRVAKNMDYVGESMEAVAQKMDKHFDTQAGIAEMNDELANN
jgi:succinate dehydrogenase/fumarate reductase-like Fe-S protein